MSLFQLILFGLLGVFIFPTLFGAIAAVVCKVLFNARDAIAVVVGVSVGVLAFITGIIFVAMAIARIAT